mmetsp:Transcript_12827/g.40950  ORF Transcript_12827/g.40950 Transcript_12827/m.40950 type:complete len:335 (-) Transcript_12827:616-1620(-)
MAETYSSVLPGTQVDSSSDIPPGAWRLERPVRALQLAFVTFLISMATLATCIALKVDGAFDSSWSIVLLPVWIVHALTVLLLGVSLCSLCTLVLRPLPPDAKEGPRLILDLLLMSLFGIVITALFVTFETLLASNLENASVSAYALAVPMLVLVGLLVCNTVLCATRNVYSAATSFLAAVAVVLICMRAEGDITTSWWVVLLPIFVGAMIMLSIAVYFYVKSAGKHRTYKLDAVQSRALAIYSICAILVIVAGALFAGREDETGQPPYAMVVAAAPLAVATLLLCVPVLQVTNRMADEVLEEGRMTHILPGTKYDVDGGEEWWLLLGRVEVLIA